MMEGTTGSEPSGESPTKQTMSSGTGGMVAVAMSGGVDSSVAALLLKEQGYNAIGISMQVWDYRNHGGSSSRATCCAPNDFLDARRVAGRIGVPYYVFNFEEEFRSEVIERFVTTYERGETPNPCIDCNQRVKFRALRQRAAGVGAPVVATGHYAQVFRDAAGWHLGRGVDPDKDQSYFLYNLTQEELAETLFPVGGMLKPDVREIARRHGLVTAEKPDSQDICFVSGSVSSFVNRIGRSHPQPGAIQNLLGETVGHHEGVHHFTVGQRRGLQIGGEAEPLYVVRIEPESRTVVVGPRSALENRSFSVSAASWCTPKPPVVGETIEGIVQVRHRHKGELSRITRVDPDKFQVEFIENWVAVSPGQAAVVYSVDNRTVLGGGRIERQKGGL